jgi:alkaline phosphatase D
MMSPVANLKLNLNGNDTDPVTTDNDNISRFNLTRLNPNTEYNYSLPCGVVGKFKTLPVSDGYPTNFKIAFSGDHGAGSTHQVFNTILDLNPDMFLHLGDMGYPNPNDNNPALFHANYDANFNSIPQHRLYRNIATMHVWDDHEYGPNDSDQTSVTKPTAAAVYRLREPYYSLVHATAIYQHFWIGRALFIVTDLRSEATPNSVTDNSSKSMLGSDQKTWFKNLIVNNPSTLIVWVCPRWFANANHADSWNNFSTERTELCDWIKLHAHGRVVVLSADKHSLGIDDGTNVDHATGGGEPLPTFQAAPLDRTPSALSGTYSHGEFNNNGQFGIMEVEDDGNNFIVKWTGYDSVGTQLNYYQFTVTL